MQHDRTLQGGVPGGLGQGGTPAARVEEEREAHSYAWNKRSNESKRETYKQWVMFLLDKKHCPYGKAEVCGASRVAIIGASYPAPAWRPEQRERAWGRSR